MDSPLVPAPPVRVALSRKAVPAGPEDGWGEVEMVGEARLTVMDSPQVLVTAAFSLSPAYMACQ